MPKLSSEHTNMSNRKWVKQKQTRAILKCFFDKNNLSVSYSVFNYDLQSHMESTGRLRGLISEFQLCFTDICHVWANEMLPEVALLFGHRYMEGLVQEKLLIEIKI